MSRSSEQLILISGGAFSRAILQLMAYFSSFRRCNTSPIVSAIETQTMNSILAVITRWNCADVVMQRAQFLAAAMNTGIRVYRPVHGQLGGLEEYIEPDNFNDLRDDVMAGERARLDGFAKGRVESVEVQWCDRVHRGVIEQAERYSAGMIVMMPGQSSPLAAITRIADDWHLLRDAPCPVLMLAHRQHPIERVIAAVDLDDREPQRLLSARVLDQALAFAKAHEVPLITMTVVPDPALVYPGMGAVVVDSDLRARLEAQAQLRLQALVDHLGITTSAIRVVVGQVEDEIATEAGETALLVIGSAANRGVKGFLLGNTAERILHRIHTEMLVVN